METIVRKKMDLNARELLSSLITPLGINFNGKEPFEPKIHDERFYHRITHEGALGLGESYMDKWWDCDRLDILFDKILRAKLDKTSHIALQSKFRWLLSHIINFQSKKRAKQVAEKHYDLGNLLFTSMLDRRMNYSCAYFANANNLDDAQAEKLDLICRKIKIKPGDSVLDIGCGFGGFAKFAAKHYGASVTGITISEKQATFAKRYTEGYPINILLKDYHDIEGIFDAVVSIGMFEHVGPLNYYTYMQKVFDVLKDDGLFLLHTIGVNETSWQPNAWTLKYIFPNGALPSIAQIAENSEKFFVMEDWHNFSAYYDLTLMTWYKNFKDHWSTLKAHYDERFYRMWTYYLLSSAGAFRARTLQLWQIVFSKNGVVGGYLSER